MRKSAILGQEINWNDEVKRKSIVDADTPEKKLALAVLIRAIIDYMEVFYSKTTPKKKEIRLFHVRKFFIEQDELIPQPFDFTYILQHITNYPEAMRKKILEFLDTLPEERHQKKTFLDSIFFIQEQKNKNKKYIIVKDYF